MRYLELVSHDWFVMLHFFFIYLDLIFYSPFGSIKYDGIVVISLLEVNIFFALISIILRSNVFQEGHDNDSLYTILISKNANKKKILFNIISVSMDTLRVMIEIKAKVILMFKNRITIKLSNWIVIYNTTRHQQSSS